MASRTMATAVLALATFLSGDQAVAAPQAPGVRTPPPVLRETILPPVKFLIRVPTAPAAQECLRRALHIDQASSSELSLILASCQQALQLLQDRHNSQEVAGANDIAAMFDEWRSRYSSVDPDKEPDRFAESQRTLNELNEQVAALRQRANRDLPRAFGEADALVRSTAERVASMSPLPEDLATQRVLLSALRLSVMDFGGDMRFGDFSRPVDVREFVAFAAANDGKIAQAFGLGEDPKGFAEPSGELGELLNQFDSRDVNRYQAVLDGRRRLLLPDAPEVYTPSEAGKRWAQQFDPAQEATAALALALERVDPAIAARFRSLFREYVCPHLTGIWVADYVVAAARETEPKLPETLSNAVEAVAADYEATRASIVSSAYDAGAAAYRKYGSAYGSDTESVAYAACLERLRGLSKRTVESVEAMLANEPAATAHLAAVTTAAAVARRQGGEGPFMRPHVKAVTPSG